MTLLMTLVNVLKAYRASQAEAQGLPRYCIFGDAVINELAKAQPVSMHSLVSIKGMGPERCSKYGQDIIAMVQQNIRQPVVVMKHSGSEQGALRRPILAIKRKAANLSLPVKKRCAFEGPEQRDDDDVYILELSQGRVYVGKSGDVSRRISQHRLGTGSAFTKAFPPTGNVLPRLGNVSGCGDAAERDETIRYMFLRGIHKVRGWRYTQVGMSAEDFEDAEANIRELFGLCRRCGNGNHFIGRCSFAFDRLGRPL